MTIKLNEFDKKLLSQITPSSKWDKLKSIYAVNSIVKQLKIGNKKIGTKCAKHLQKLSKQDTTNINEIREGCIDLRIKKKQTLPLTKDKTKRPVESVHKINKATDKAPTGKTEGGGDKNKFRDGTRKTGKGGGGAAQPQADLIGGLFNAFKAQQAKQARDTQYNELDAQRRQSIVNQQIPQGAAGDALRQRMQGAAAQQYLDALKEGSNITGLSQGERLLYQELANQRLNQQQANQYSISGQTMSSEGGNLFRELENKIYAAREQDLTNVSIPSTPRTASMFNPTQEEKNKLAMDLLESREKNLSSVQASVKRKQEMLKEKVAEADIYAEQQRQSMIQNKIGIQTENYINREREEIKSNVLNKNMNHKEAQKKLQQLNTFYLKQLEYEQQQRVNKNIFDDIEEIERNRQFRLRNRKVGVDSVLSRLRNNESQEQQDRLVNDLIINQNEKKMKDIQSELLGSVSNRVEANERQQLQTTQNLKNEIMGNIQQRGKKMQNVDEKFVLEKQELQKVLNTIEQQQEQERADRAMREFVSRQNLSEFNQQAQPLGLTRTSSLSLLERMEADSLRQARENQDLQRTLSAGDNPSQDLDVEIAKRKIREQQESEAIFNRKQQELAQQIQNLKTEPPLMAFGEEDNTTAKPIEKKVSPRDDESPPSELPSEEMLEFMYRTNYSPLEVEEMEREKQFREQKKREQDEEDYEYFEEHYTQGTDEAGDAINDLKNNLNQYKNTGNIKSNFLEEDDEEFIKTKNELKKLKPQELDKLIQLTDKLDNDLGYETSGSYKDYGKKQYANAVKSKNELYDFAKSININVDTLAFERGETIDENLPVFSDSD